MQLLEVSAKALIMTMALARDNQQMHKFEACVLPSNLKKCAYCLVFSLNGSGHSNGCLKAGTKSIFIGDVYAKIPVPVFKIRLENVNDTLHLLNNVSGIFDEVQTASIHTHEIDESFDIIHNISSKSVITFSSTLVHRFSVVMAYLIDGVWRLRYRLVVTQCDGILCFPLWKTFESIDGVHQISTDDNPD